MNKLKINLSKALKSIPVYFIGLSFAYLPLYGGSVEPVSLPEKNEDTVILTTNTELHNIEDVNIDSLAKAPSYKWQEEDLPKGYGFTAFSNAPMADDSNWWATFDDPVLSRLELLAVNNNYNLRSMLKKIEASRQMIRQVKSGNYPSVSLMAGYDISRDSGRESVPYSDSYTDTFFQLGATISWEIDIFGRIRQKLKESNASLDATRLEFEGMQLSLEAEVASQYSTLLMCRQQLFVAMTHLKTQEEVLKIAEARYNAGLVSKLDVAQANSMVSSTRLLLPKYRTQAYIARNALSMLCGVSARDIETITEEAAMPQLAVPLQVGVPADLVRRRPDVAESEKQIEALAASIGVAKKAYLPSLSLNATLGVSSHEMRYMFGKNSFNYEINPTLTWTLFDGLSREAGVAEAKANMEAQIESYNMTLSTAITEVENAMQNYVAAGRELTLYRDVLDSSKEVVDLSLERYRRGLTDFTDVATAQITYMQNHTNYQSSRANLFNCIVDLYKALGGGFSGLTKQPK